MQMKNTSPEVIHMSEYCHRMYLFHMLLLNHKIVCKRHSLHLFKKKKSQHSDYLIIRLLRLVIFQQLCPVKPIYTWLSYAKTLQALCHDVKGQKYHIIDSLFHFVIVVSVGELALHRCSDLVHIKQSV